MKKKSFEITCENTHAKFNEKLISLDFIKCKTILTQHIDRVLSIVIWKNRYLFTASIDDRIHIYNIITSKKIGQLPSFNDPVVSMQIIENPKNSYLCFSDLCQRLFLIDLKTKLPIRHYNHDADILLMVDLKDNRNILISDCKGKIFCWDFLKNKSNQHLEENKEELMLISAMKLLNEQEHLVGISYYTNKKVIIINVLYEKSNLKKLIIVKSFQFQEKICSFNFSKSLNKLYVGTNDSSIIIVNLKDNEKIESENHKLFCSPCSEINEFILIEGENSNSWGVIVNNFDRKLFIVDLKNKENYEVRDDLISVYYFSVKSKIQLLEWKNQLFMALVSHEGEIVLFYEIIYKI